MFVAGSRPLRTYEGRSGIPGCSSGRMPKTVTVPPVTGVLIRARKVPDTLPARYSTSLFAGTPTRDFWGLDFGRIRAGYRTTGSNSALVFPMPTKGQTVTVPPVTGVLIRALNMPDTFPA
jgi:hypothetical protein